MNFSERYGHVLVRSALQIDRIDDDLRNRLWNLVCAALFPSLPSHRGASTIDYLPNHQAAQDTLKNLWHNYFKQTTDGIGLSYFVAVNEVKTYFMGRVWYQVYDLLEFMVGLCGPHARQDFISSVNSVLKQELSGYRLVSGHIVQITNEDEIVAIEQALALPDSLKPVREHLRQSLTLLADKKAPDYRNSIKESISAVESLAKIISKQNKATLSPALNAVEKNTKLHPVLKEAFQKLYSYTSDAQGIRHALMDEPNLDIEDAKFMLVSCSAFVNYLVKKTQKAGIAI